MTPETRAQMSRRLVSMAIGVAAYLAGFLALAAFCCRALWRRGAESGALAAGVPAVGGRRREGQIGNGTRERGVRLRRAGGQAPSWSARSVRLGM